MDADTRVTVTLSPIATPLPLTFVGLAIASIILSGLELGWIPKSEVHTTGWVLLAVPVPLQLVASYFGFHARSASGATGSSTLAAAWLGSALALVNAAPGEPVPSNAVGLLSFGVGAALMVPAVSEAYGGSLLPAATLALAALRFLLTGVAGISHGGGVVDASGIVGCAVAAAALYAALALELESVGQGAVLPTFRRKRSAVAMLAPFDAQVERLDHEAGIRKSL